MSIVLSCWNSSCATLNLWGDLDTRSSNSGFPGKTASKLRLMKLILARPVSWTLLTHCFPYWRAIPAFCLFYWYVAFTKMGCYPGPDSGGFVVLKAFSDVMKPRILIEGTSTDFHLPEKPYVGNGTVCMLSLSLSSIYCDRKGSSECCLERIWRVLLMYAMENPIPSSIQVHSWVLQILQCQPLKKLFCKFGSNAFATDRWEEYDEQELWKSSVQRTGLEGTAFCLRFSFCLVLTGESCQRILKYCWVFRTANNMFYCS